MSLAGTAFIEVGGNFAAFDRQAAMAASRFQKRMDTTWSNVGQKLTSSGAAMSRTGSRLTHSVTLPLAAISVAAIKASADFGASMEMVHTQAGASQKEVDGLRGKVLELAKSMPQGPNELAKGLFHLESVGLRGAKAMDALKIAADGAAVGHADLEETATALGSAWLVNIKGAGDLRHVMGILNATVGAGNVRMGDLVQALGTGLLPASKEAGLGITDVMGAMAVFTDEGYQASSAAAQFSTALHFLYAPTSKASGAMKDIGLKSNQLAIDMHKPDGLLVALRDLKTHLEEGGRSAVDQEQILAKILPGGRGRIMLTLINQLDRYQMKLDQIKTGTANFGEAVAKTQQTASYKIKAAWSDIQVAAVKVGDSIGPPLVKIGADVAGSLGGIAEDFSKLPPGAQSLILKGGLVLAGIGPGMKLLGLFTSGIGRLYNVALIASRLIRGQGLDAFAKTGPGKVSSAVATMEVGTLVARSVVGGAGGGGTILGGRRGETRSPGGVILPKGSDAARAAETGGEGAIAGATASTLARGLLSRLLRGGGVALAGGLGAQLLGSFVGGKAGKTIGHVGGSAAIGAGIGTMIEPGIGTAVGAALGAGFELFIHHHAKTEGEKIGSKVADGMKKTAVGAMPNVTHAIQKGVDDANKRLPKQARQAQGVPANIRDRNANRIDQPTARQLAERNQLLFKGGVDAGTQWGQGLAKASKHLDLGMLQQNAKAALAKMPPQMRAGAAQSMEAFVKQMQHDKRLPEGSLKQFISTMNHQFPSLVRGFDYAGAASSRALAARLKLDGAQKNVQSFLNFLKGPNGWQAIPKTADVNTQNAAEVFGKNLTFLHQEAKNTTGQTRKDALANFKTLKDRGISYFEDLKSGIRAQTQAIVKTLGKDTAAGKEAMRTGYQKLVGVITQEMGSGVISVGDALKQINKLYNKEAKALGIRPLEGVSVAIAVPGHDVGTTDPTAARGAIIGRPGDRGPDDQLLYVRPQSVILNADQQRALGYAQGGLTPVVAARGEAVFEPEAAPELNRRAARYGGLHGLFSRFTRPHYATPRYASGGLTQMLAEANAIDSHHYPYKWGGGHGGFTGPYDCSGAVSAVLHAGGLLGQPMVASQFENFGQPGPGAVTLYASDGHVYMSLDGRFFGTSNANPGGGAGWFNGAPRAGFTVRHVPASGGTIPTPKIGGAASDIKTVVQNAVKGTAKGANKKLSDAIAALGQIGGGDAGDSMGSGHWAALVAKVGLPGIFNWIIDAESGGDPKIVNSIGATGLTQVLVSAHPDLARRFNLLDPEQNLEAAKILYQSDGLAPWASSRATWGKHLSGHARGGIVGAFQRLAGGGVAAAVKPLFTREGPRYYDAAYKHNRPFALGGSYQTKLKPDQEHSFRHWVNKHHAPFDVNAKISDYDMRGFWASGAKWDGGHFPDTWKTPYDTSFSHESRFATRNNPFYWHGDRLIDQRNGQVIFASGGGIVGALRGFASGGIARAAAGIMAAGTHHTRKRKGHKRLSKVAKQRRAITAPFTVKNVPDFSHVTDAKDADLTRLDSQESLLETIAGMKLPDGTDKTVLDVGDVAVLADTFPPAVTGGEAITDAQLANRRAALQDMIDKVGLIKPALGTIAHAITERETRKALVQAFLQQQFKRYKSLAQDLSDLKSGNARRRLNAALDQGRRGKRINDAKDTITHYQALIADERGKGKHANHGLIRQWEGKIRDENTFIRKERAHGKSSITNAKVGVIRDNIQNELKPIQQDLDDFGGSRTAIGHTGSSPFSIGNLNSDLDTLHKDQSGSGSLGEALATLLQSDIPKIKLDIQTLGAPAPATPGADSTTSGTDDTGRADTLQQLLDQAHLALNVSQAQYEVLKGFPPYGGSFAGGGVVPGPLGAPRTVIAHGGETIDGPIGRDGPDVRVVVEDHRVRVFVDDVEQIVDQRMRQVAVGAGRGLPSRGGGLMG